MTIKQPFHESFSPERVLDAFKQDAEAWINQLVPRQATLTLSISVGMPASILVVAPTEKWAKQLVPRLKLPKDREIQAVGAFTSLVGRRLSRAVLVELDQRHEDWIRAVVLPRIVPGGEVQSFHEEQVHDLFGAFGER